MRAGSHAAAWWNNYGRGAGTVTPRELRRAQDLRDRGGFVITKAGYWAAFEAFKQTGVRLAVEVYAYPDKAAGQVQQLLEGIRRGAEFIVVNAEVEWQQQPAGAMRAWLSGIPADIEVYSCTDTRGGRLALPYQLELKSRCSGFMPMIYPKAFQQDVTHAFRSSLDSGQNFGGKPVLPAIQTYDGPGAAMVRDQVAECSRRGLPGCQAYTLNEGHATDDEWAAFLAALPAQEDDLDANETLKLIIPEIDKRVGATNGLLSQVGTYARDTRTALALLADKVNASGAVDLADVKAEIARLQAEDVKIEAALKAAGQALGGG